MQPQQPYEAPPPPAPDYNFILNPQQPKRPGLFNFGGGSTAMRALVVIGIIFVLMIVFVAVRSALGGGSSATPALVTVAQDQQKLLHLAASGQQQSTSDTVQNFAATAQLSLASEQQELLAYLSDNGHKVGDKELGLAISQSTDDQLAAAKSASTFDDTFKTIMADNLKAYRSDLQKAYQATSGPKGRALLNDDYKAAQLLLKQLEG